MRTKQPTEEYSFTKKRGDGITFRVHAKISGKPRLQLGVWLIKLGVRIAQVHVRVWIDQEPRHVEEK